MSRTFKERVVSSFSESPIERCIVKSTDSEPRPPKEKHLQKLLKYTHRHDVTITDVVDVLFKRMASRNWIVLMKSLVVFHRLFRDGHERVFQFMCARSSLFETVVVHSSAEDGYLVIDFIRNYCLYLNAKVETYRALGYEFCHVRGIEAGKEIKKLPPNDLFEMIIRIQRVVDSLLKIVRNECISAEAAVVMGDLSRILIHDIVKCVVILLSKDILRLFVTLNDGMINLLERFFKLQGPELRQGFELYRRFADECTTIDRFIHLCKSHQLIDGDSIPTLSEAPRLLLPSLEAFANGQPLPESSAGRENVRVHGTQRSFQAMEDGIDSQGSTFMKTQGWTRFDSGDSEEGEDDPFAPRTSIDSNC